MVLEFKSRPLAHQGGGAKKIDFGICNRANIIGPSAQYSRLCIKQFSKR